MQIGLLNHLNFPKGGNQPLSASTDESKAAADGTAEPGLGAAALATAPTQPLSDAPSVILKLQSEADIARAGLAKGLVYTDSLKATANKNPQDFVTFAVSAMRDYADEQARLKAASQTSDGPSAASLIPRSFAEVQKLASRFKLFA
jgi:hypothetical protein